MSLVRESRYGDAAGVLAEVAVPASRFPEDDARLLEVRRQIGELEVGVGDVDKARVTLTDLRNDLTRLYGLDHGATIRVSELLASLS